MISVAQSCGITSKCTDDDDVVYSFSFVIVSLCVCVCTIKQEEGTESRKGGSGLEHVLQKPRAYFCVVVKQRQQQLGTNKVPCGKADCSSRHFAAVQNDRLTKTNKESISHLVRRRRSGTTNERVSSPHHEKNEIKNLFLSLRQEEEEDRLLRRRKQFIALQHESSLSFSLLYCAVS